MFMNDDGSGSVDSTVEINDLTTNGPTLNNGERFGYSIANIGDLDGDGVGDLAVGAAYDDGDGGTNRGAVHIMFMNASISRTTEVPLSETLSFTDVTSKGQSVTQTISESISLTDSVSKDTDKKLSESISLIDSASRAGATTVSLSESITLLDSVSNAPEITL